MAKSFKEFEGVVGKSVCPRCRENPTSGAVGIRLNKIARPHSSHAPKLLTSRQINMCEQCSVEVYEMIFHTLTTEANGGSRLSHGGDTGIELNESRM